jgi:hypothetical protein
MKMNAAKPITIVKTPSMIKIQRHPLEYMPLPTEISDRPYAICARN